MNITIRTASVKDAPKLLEIYAYYVEHTAITYEYEVPTLDDFQRRIATTLQNYPYLVAEADGEIAGYVYASRFRSRAAYDWCVETSVYLDTRYQRLGIGRMLYRRLEDILKEQHITNLYACIADSEEEDESLTKDSEYFHAAMEYKTVGRFQKSGSKFGRWYNLIVMEKVIGEHTCPPKEFIPYSRLQTENKEKGNEKDA